jgi:hypothetical protein
MHKEKKEKILIIKEFSEFMFFESPSFQFSRRLKISNETKQKLRNYFVKNGEKIIYK